MAQKFAGLTPELRKKLFKKKSLKIWVSVISQYLLFPILCWLALEIFSVFLTDFNQKPINIIGTFFLPAVKLYLIYRLIALSISLFWGRDIYVSFISRFLFPLFLTYVVIKFLSLFTDISLLSKTEIFNLSGTSITIRSFFIASLGLYFWFAGINGTAQFLRKVMVEKLMIQQNTLDAYFILIRYFLVCFGLFIVFRELELDPAAVAAISGGLAVGLGFGLKDILTNFISGIILLFERSIRPGDFIEYNGEIGRVEEVNLRSTTIKTVREIEFIIPNQAFLSNTLISYTRKTPKVRYIFPVEISCKYDPEKVTQIILEGLREDPNILMNLTSIVLVKKLGVKNVYDVIVWIEDHLKLAGVRSNVYKHIFNAFSIYGIELDMPIPYSIEMIQDSPTLNSELSEIPSQKNVPTQPVESQSPDKLLPDNLQKKGKMQRSHQMKLVEDSFAKIRPHINDFVNTFYLQLFEKKPKLRPLFRNTDTNKMGEKMFDALDIVIKNLQDPMKLQGILKELGGRHKNYGVIEEYYLPVCETLMETFAKYIPDDWTPEVEQAWSSIFQAVSQIMLEGYTGSKKN